MPLGTVRRDPPESAKADIESACQHPDGVLAMTILKTSVSAAPCTAARRCLPSPSRSASGFAQASGGRRRRTAMRSRRCHRPPVPQRGGCGPTRQVRSLAKGGFTQERWTCARRHEHRQECLCHTTAREPPMWIQRNEIERGSDDVAQVNTPRSWCGTDTPVCAVTIGGD